MQEGHDDFVDAIFKTEKPMPAMVSGETFRPFWGETLEEECSYDVVQAVQDHLTQMIDVHKESKEPEPLTISSVGCVRY